MEKASQILSRRMDYKYCATTNTDQSASKYKSCYDTISNHSHNVAYRSKSTYDTHFATIPVVSNLILLNISTTFMPTTNFKTHNWNIKFSGKEDTAALFESVEERSAAENASHKENVRYKGCILCAFKIF